MIEELNCILVGILAGPEDLPPDRELVIFVNSIGELQFALKVISDGPDILPLDKPITCYANKFSDYDFNDNYYDDYPVRARSFEKFIKDKVVLFRPVRQQKKGEVLYSAEPVMVLPKPSNINRDTRLIPMLYLNDDDYEDYENYILDRQPIGPFRYYPQHMPVIDPIYVYINGFLYGDFDSRVERHNKWIFGYKEPLRRISCDLFEYENIITYKDVAFVESFLYLQDFPLLLASDGEEFKLPGETIIQQKKSDPNTGNNSDSFENKEKGTLANNDNLQKILGMMSTASPDVNKNVVTLAETGQQIKILNPDEVEFINKFNKHCRFSGMLYDEDDLCNFHIDLKVNNFVVLAGMSGTGKSRLVCLYAEALGLTNEQCINRFKFIPVRPTWTDETDLIGFLDTFNNIYRPADTGLLDLLLDAEKNQDKLYLVCFDEMNLARVEHYFAQLLSILELPEDNRVLQLYNPGLAERVYNSYQYPPQVKVGRNVLMVGTINIDESTYSFSDKVLDRASMLRLKILPFTRLAELTEETVADNNVNKNNEISATQFLGWVNQGDFYLNTSEIEFLYELHKIINKADAKKGIGYRSLRHIDNYLRNIPRDEKGPLLNRAKAFDYQLIQRILPMLRGPQQMLKFIGIYSDATDEVEDSELLKLMDDYSNISDFNSSRAEIKQKAKELRWFGYVS